MGSIFVSYRREDAEGQAGRLYDDLVAEFGSDSVFMDVAAIQPGRDFRKAIDQSLTSCGVFLSLIGKNWLSAKDPSGLRRLDDPADFVRIETAAALKRDIPVIPVLVQGASVPKPDQIPGDLQDLAYRNAIELTHARWDSDVQLLIRALRPHVSPANRQPEPKITPPSKKPTSVKSLILTTGILVVVLGIALYFWRGSAVATPPAKESPEGGTVPPDAKTLAPKQSYPEKAAASGMKAANTSPRRSKPENFSLAATQAPLANNPKRYTFTLSLKDPDGAIDEISRVHYDLVYDPNPLSLESSTAPAFSAVYEGWGCYETVVMTVYFKSPGSEPQKKTFNMCKALN